MKIPSSSSLTIQCNDTQHHRITGSFGFKDFEGTSEESAYWSRASEEQKQELKKKHVDTGQCLLCMIDDLTPKSPEPQRVVIETEKRRTHEKTPSIPSKIIVGGIINRGHERAEASSEKYVGTFKMLVRNKLLVFYSGTRIISETPTGRFTSTTLDSA